MSNQKENIDVYDIASPRARSELLLHHPLMTSTVLFETRPTLELFQSIKRSIVLRDIGCCFTGASGIGKSKAIEVAARLIAKRMQNLVIFRHNYHNQQYPSIRAFFKHFLATVRHHEKRGETFDLQERLTKRMIDVAADSGLPIVLLIIDEAQAMTVSDLLFLKDVSNALEHDGIGLVTIFVGQERQFRDLYAAAQREERDDIIGRFLLRRLPFPALKTQEDVAAILTEIDKAIFPEGSEWTWTRFFFPIAYENGFRMSNEAERFFRKVVRLCPGSGPDRAIPARQLFQSIRTFMYDNAEYDSSNMALPKDAWKKAIEHSHLPDAIALIAASQKDSEWRIKT